MNLQRERDGIEGLKKGIESLQGAVTNVKQVVEEVRARFGDDINLDAADPEGIVRFLGDQLEQLEADAPIDGIDPDKARAVARVVLRGLEEKVRYLGA